MRTLPIICKRTRSVRGAHATSYLGTVVALCWNMTRIQSLRNQCLLLCYYIAISIAVVLSLSISAKTSASPGRVVDVLPRVHIGYRYIIAGLTHITQARFDLHVPTRHTVTTHHRKTKSNAACHRVRSISASAAAACFPACPSITAFSPPSSPLRSVSI